MAPTTIEEVLRVLLGKPGKGTPGKVHSSMTPTRWTHALELLQAGVSPDLVTGATNRIEASGWLQKRVEEVSESDLDEARRIGEAYYGPPPSIDTLAGRSPDERAPSTTSVNVDSPRKTAKMKRVDGAQLDLFASVTKGSQ